MKTTTRKYTIIHKESTSETDSDSNSDSNSNSDSDSDGNESKVSEKQVGGKNAEYQFKSIVDSKYIKPKSGSKQDYLSKDDIKQKLEGFIALKTMDDKKYLLQLNPFKTWVRYYNVKTKQFRIGGLLKYVDKQLRYIMLVNTKLKITWSIQVEDCIIFVPNPEIQKEKQDLLLKEQKQQKQLFELYKAGKLRKK